MSEFFAMGGFAAFVWPSYALAALVMLGFLASSLARLRQLQRSLAESEARRSGRRRREAQI